MGWIFFSAGWRLIFKSDLFSIGAEDQPNSTTSKKQSVVNDSQVLTTFKASEEKWMTWLSNAMFLQKMGHFIFILFYFAGFWFLFCHFNDLFLGLCTLSWYLF